ncbi:MAG: LEA type 2 family protein [Bacteroidota bacterium]
MQKSLGILFCIFWLNGCSFTEKPEFVAVNTLEIVKADLEEVILKADAVFHNPNHLGGKLHTDTIDVYVDDHQVAQVSSETFEVPPQDEFTIPLTVNFETSKILEGNSKGLLGSILNQILNKKIQVRFQGDIGYTVLGFSATYTLDHSEEIQIDYR